MPDAQVIQLEDNREAGSNTEDLTGEAGYAQDLYNEYKASSYRVAKLAEIAEGRKRYKGQRDPKKFPWPDCSNLSVGLDAIAIDNLEPRVFHQFIGEDDFIHVEPVGDEDAQHVDSVKQAANWMVANNAKIGRPTREMAHNLLLDGTVDVIPIYTEDTRVKKIRQLSPVFQTPDGTRVRLPEQLQHPQLIQQLGLTPALEEDEREEEYTEFKVQLDIIPLNESFWPDVADDWDEQPFLWLTYPTVYDLEEMSEENGGPYKNISMDLVIDPARLGDEHKDEHQQDQGIRHSEHTKQIKVLNCAFKWENEWIITAYAIDAGWVEIRNQPMSEAFPHGRKPVHRFKIFSESNESCGTGIPQKIRHYSSGADQMFNQMIDSGDIELSPWFFYQETPGFSSIDLQVWPGRGIAIGKDSQVTVPNFGTKSRMWLQDIQSLLGFFERMISLSDYTMGKESQTAGKGGETYSGMALIVQEGNIKHRYQGQGLRSTFEALITDVFTLYAYFMPRDTKMRVFENGQWAFQPVDVEAIQGRFDLKIHVSDSSANKMLTRKEAMERLTVFAKNPVFNQITLAKDALKAYDITEGQMQQYINPQFTQLLMAFQQIGPDLLKVAEQLMQQKGLEKEKDQVTKEAEKNIRRRETERAIEQRPGVEDNKLFDQAMESVKRKLYKPMAEQAVVSRFADRLTGGQ